VPKTRKRRRLRFEAISRRSALGSESFGRAGVCGAGFRFLPFDLVGSALRVRGSVDVGGWGGGLRGRARVREGGAGPVFDEGQTAWQWSAEARFLSPTT
jgi:hypothetical protein